MSTPSKKNRSTPRSRNSSTSTRIQREQQQQEELVADEINEEVAILNDQVLPAIQACKRVYICLCFSVHFFFFC